MEDASCPVWPGGANRGVERKACWPWAGTGGSGALPAGMGLKRFTHFSHT